MSFRLLNERREVDDEMELTPSDGNSLKERSRFEKEENSKFSPLHN